MLSLVAERHCELYQRTVPSTSESGYAVSLEISEMLISFLMGHSLQGVSAKYTNELMIANSEALRAAQERISRRIFELLGLTLGRHHEATLAPSMPSTKMAKVAAPASMA